MYRILDILLWPFMWVFGGINFPVQETHPWHVKKHQWIGKGTKIIGSDVNAKFSHTGISKYFGFYHMPILGGLTKYVILEASGFDNYWNVGWDNYIQILKIYNDKIKLLVGKEGFSSFALADTKKEIELKIVGFGELGDRKYNGIRLF